MKHIKCPSCGNGVQFITDVDGHQVCPSCNYHLPREIGHFKLVELLGTGGMGAVFRGIDTSLQREVAVKIMRDEMTKSEKFVSDFLREARATAALNHPNIAKIYTCGEEGGRYFIVMELLQKGSLDDRICDGERLGEIEVLDIGIQVTSGLREAQKHGLIHRDIKPGNILFDEEGTAKLVDFGLARLEDQSEVNLREEGIWGTPYYIAPEKVGRNQEDFRSDIYSLGGTLFHTLAGRAPFEAETSNEVVEKHLQAASVSLQAFAPHVAPQTAYVIGRMMRREPSERPQSYEQLLDELFAAKEVALKRKAFQRAGLKSGEGEESLPWGALVSVVLVFIACVISLTYLWQNRDRYFGDSEKAHAGKVEVLKSSTKEPKLSVEKSPKPVAPAQLPPVVQTQINWEKPWQTAQETLASGKPSLAVAQLEAISTQLPADHFQQPWLNLQLGVASLISGNPEQANRHFISMLEKAPPSSQGAAVSTEQLPFKYAEAFLGRISFDDLGKQLMSNPPWAMALLHFYSGLKAQQGKDFEKMFLEWKTYATSVPADDQAWVWTFKPLVQGFLDEYPACREGYANAEKALSKNDPERAKDTLKKMGELDYPVLRELVRDLSSRVDKAMMIKKENEAALARAEMERKRKDSEKIFEDAKKEEESLIQKYDFQEILNVYARAKKKIETEEIRKKIDCRLRRAEKMAEFKITVLKEIQSTPCSAGKLKTRNGSRLIGTLVKADDTELVFKLEGGMIKADWIDLTPESMLSLGEFYLQKALAKNDLSGAARRAYSLAALAHAFHLQPNFLSYMDVIQTADPVMKTDADKMFSNLN